MKGCKAAGLPDPKYDFTTFGGNYTLDYSLKIQCAIIDKSLCWYGDINFLGYHATDNTVMRIDDANIAGELLDIVLDNQT